MESYHSKLYFSFLKFFYYLKQKFFIKYSVFDSIAQDSLVLAKFDLFLTSFSEHLQVCMLIFDVKLFSC